MRGRTWAHRERVFLPGGEGQHGYAVLAGSHCLDPHSDVLARGEQPALLHRQHQGRSASGSCQLPGPCQASPPGAYSVTCSQCHPAQRAADQAGVKVLLVLVWQDKILPGKLRRCRPHANNQSHQGTKCPEEARTESTSSCDDNDGRVQERSDLTAWRNADFDASGGLHLPNCSGAEGHLVAP